MFIILLQYPSSHIIQIFLVLCCRSDFYYYLCLVFFYAGSMYMCTVMSLVPMKLDKAYPSMWKVGK